MKPNWIPANWSAPGNIVAGCTLRHGGASAGRYDSLNVAAHVGDEPPAVSENRRRFVADCQLPAEPMWLNQVHGVHVSMLGDGADADAIVIADTNAVCVIQTADCLPIVFASADGSEVAAAHAGWRGLADGVVEATVSAMRTEPGNLQAWLGPAISQDAFEVGDDVRYRFLQHDSAAASCFAANAAGRWQADLCGLAKRRLAAAGVSEVAGGNYCTFSEPDAFFSYRRDGQCGRMATFVYRQ